MIGVCIKYFHENYGGMLQAYATVKILEKRNLDYELIHYKKKRTTPEKIKSIPRLFNRVLLNDKYEDFLKKQGLKKHKEFKENDAVRMEAFKKFRENNFTKLSKPYVGYKELCEGANNYDIVVTGSDQLWSPAGLPTNYYNLQFVPDGVKKVSYASSFGVNDIPWYQKRRTKEFLDRIDFISMREERGSKIVKELTGKDVPTILDPVFMFSKEEWNQMIPFKQEVEKPYVFAYFLGNTPKHREEVKRYAKKNKLKIVTIRHMDQYVESDENFGDVALYDVGPDMFLNLIRGAECIFTDSFHGTCFSIIYEKNFVVFDRYENKSKLSKNSRIDTLCNVFGLSEKRFKNDVFKNADKELDYEKIKECLLEHKKAADEYLDKALK